ncbi:NADPH-dependent F420 reductase [Mangrovicoccus sp. HB161399]|uniref:NADPH-dependent F420 reductase n=1 Tax=Mangrovicoccus sp. HB161399 TaxID=2720392 RepID=UPI001557C099|nr:NAD(P)-binding domain-containing protein [Mangrovicoccus sp. HB161399]
MRIGILGSGLMGGKLGTIWARCGHDVTFAYARSASKLERLAKGCGGRAGSVAEAAEDADALLLAVHWSRVPDVLEQAGELAGKTVISCTLPLDGGNSRLVIGTSSSGAEELARLRPEARWVQAFSTTPSESFFPVFGRKGQDAPPHVMICGDDAQAKETAFALARDVGFEPQDTGGLRNARFVEPFALATVELAYVQPGGPAWTYRFTKLR